MRATLSLVFLLFLSVPGLASAGTDMPKFRSQVPFAKFSQALQRSIRAHRMGLVCHTSAQRGARSIGVQIKGNQVLMVFRPDFAVRMLKASVAAGFEAPIRIYIYENEDGTATLTYKKPSAVFRPYGSAELGRMARELDTIFEAIVRDALAAR